MYESGSSVMTRITSHQSFNIFPHPFRIKGHIVYLLSNVTRPSCFFDINCFVNLVLKSFQATKCYWGWYAIVGTNAMEYSVPCFKGGGEGITTEVEPSVVLTIVSRRCLFPAANDGLVVLSVVEGFTKSIH